MRILLTLVILCAIYMSMTMSSSPVQLLDEPQTLEEKVIENKVAEAIKDNAEYARVPILQTLRGALAHSKSEFAEVKN